MPETIGLLCVVAAVWVWIWVRQTPVGDPNRAVNLFGVVALTIAGLGFLQLLVPLLGLGSLAILVVGLVGVLTGRIPFTQVRTRRQSV